MAGDQRIGAWPLALRAGHPYAGAISWCEMLWRKNAGRAVNEFLQWEAMPRDGRPFFAFINFFDAHNPFRPARPIRYPVRRPSGPTLRCARQECRIFQISPLTRSSLRGISTTGRSDTSTVPRPHADRAGSARRVEEHDRRSITSDHGEQFGEHELIGHGNSLYSQVLHVPARHHISSQGAGWLCRWHKRSDFVTSRPRCSTLAGLPNDRGLQGRSLTRFWEQPDGLRATPMSLIVSEMPGASASNGVSLIADGHHYVRWWRNGRKRYMIFAQTRANKPIWSELRREIRCSPGSGIWWPGWPRSTPGSGRGRRMTRSEARVSQSIRRSGLITFATDDNSPGLYGAKAHARAISLGSAETDDDHR